MALIVEQILTEGIAALSYLIGDDTSRTAAVIDPRTDIDVYLEIARRHQVAITHVFETHNHADFVSGALRLHRDLPCSKLCVSSEGGIEYGFPHTPVRHGQEYNFGSIRLRAQHTPGHTPEHMSYLVIPKDGDQEHPWAVLTGDSLFADSVGRPDLLGDRTEELVPQLYTTLYDFYLGLPDGVLLYPAHGKGSACGADIGDRLVSSVGYERRFNRFLKYESNVGAFGELVLSTAPAEPGWYRRTKEANRLGPESAYNREPIALPPSDFARAVHDQDGVVVDTRSMLAFGGGHIRNALNIGARPELSIWAGWLLEPNQSVFLVLEKDQEIDNVCQLLIRTGIRRISGYLAGGMVAWVNAGQRIVSLDQLPVHKLAEIKSDVQVLDVRTGEEYESGHIQGSRHVPLQDLRAKLNEVTPGKPVAVYCDSGYRASIGASILQANQLGRVYNVPGSWKAWVAASLG